MKKLSVIILLLILGTSNQIYAQDAFTKQDSLEYLRQYKIYTSAVRYADLEVARNALYNLLVINPGNGAFADSLTLVYMDLKMFASAALLSQDIINGNPNNVQALEIGAYAFEQIGLNDRALPLYESLYLKNDNTLTLYKIAVLQIGLARFKEATTNLDIVLGRSDANEVNLYFTGKDNTQLEVPLRAAILNLKGFIAAKEDRKEEAKKFYQQALILSPEFEIARKNLEELMK